MRLPRVPTASWWFLAGLSTVIAVVNPGHAPAVLPWFVVFLSVVMGAAHSYADLCRERGR